MRTPAVTACVLVLAICFPATCKGQYYRGANGWRQYWQPSNTDVCDRAYPARQTNGYVHSCRYYCSGLPVRFSFEQDGTPCYTGRWIAGACYAGRCQTGWWPVHPPAASEAPATEAPVTVAPAAAAQRASLEDQGWSWPSEDAESQRCTRADPQVPTVRRSCRYICKGWPIRHENEADGTACQLSWWREGFCFRGHCQRNYPLPLVPRHEDNEIEGGSDPVRNFRCRNYKERVKVDGVARSCQFVCKQRRKAFVVNEENGTPCAALPGQNGFCDRGVCKPVVTTAAPTEATQAPTEQETKPSVAVVSSVTDVAPLAAVTATEEDVAAAETEEAVTAVSSTGEEELDTEAPAIRSPWTPGFVGVQCDRAYPPKVVDGRVLKCRFLCQGYPLLRIGFEEDGTPCLKKKTIEGVCFNGKCKPLPPSTDATTLKEETTTAQSYVTEAVAHSTAEKDETATDVRASTDDAKAASLAATATEGEVSDATSASETGTPGTADVEDTSAATDRSRTATEGEHSDATTASESGVSAASDVDETAATSETSRTATEGEVADTTSASEGGASAAADVEETSAATESSRTAAEGEVADATSASESGASAGSDAEETSATSESTRTAIEGGVADATSASESGASAASDVEETSAASESSRTATEGEVADATSASESGASAASDIEETSAASESSRTASEGEVADATSPSESGASAASDIEETSAASESSRTATEGEGDDATSASESGASAAADVDESSAASVSSRTASEGEVADVTSASESAASAADVEVTSAASESSGTAREAEVSDATSASKSAASAVADIGETSLSTDSSRTAAEGVVGDATLASASQTSATNVIQVTTASTDSETQPGTSTDAQLKESVEESQESTEKSVPSDEAYATTTATLSHDESEEAPTASVAAGSDLESATQPNAEESTKETEQPETEAQKATFAATDETAGRDEQDDQVAMDGESTALSSSSDVTTAPVATTEDSSYDPALNTDDSVSGSGAASGHAVELETYAPGTSGASAGESTPATEYAGVIVERTEKTVIVATGEDLTNVSEGVTEAGSAATEATKEENLTESVTQGKDNAERDSTHSSFGDITTTVSVGEELTTNQAALTTGVSPNKAATEVGAESMFTTYEGPVSHPDEGDATTPSLISATEAQQDVIEGTEASSAHGKAEGAAGTEESPEVKNVATDPTFTGEATEGTTAADESATVKIITTITRKEIVRPVDSDASQADATLVQKTKSTSVETLPISVLNDTAQSSPVVPADESPSESSVVPVEDAANTDAVSSGPSLVITDFVQKTAESSKDPATTPSVQRESEGAAESGSEVNVNV